jgi:hypothetical protein
MTETRDLPQDKADGDNIMNFDEQFAAPAPPEMTAPGMVHPTETLIGRLTADEAKPTEILNEFLSGLDLLPYLEAEPSELKRWLGHPTLIGKIRAGIWQTEPLKGRKTGPLVFPDPARHYDIHFELQIQLWKHQMALYLHHETNAYFSEEKLRMWAPAESVAQYYQRREEFIREFTALEPVPGFKISPGTVQIGKAVYDFDGKTPEEVAAWLAPVIDEVACNVNLALYKVEIRRKLAAASSSLFADSATSVNGTDIPATTDSAPTGNTQA